MQAGGWDTGASTTRQRRGIAAAGSTGNGHRRRPSGMAMAAGGFDAEGGATTGADGFMSFTPAAGLGGGAGGGMGGGMGGGGGMMGGGGARGGGVSVFNPAALPVGGAEPSGTISSAGGGGSSGGIGGMGGGVGGGSTLGGRGRRPYIPVASYEDDAQNDRPLIEGALWWWPQHALR